MWGPRTRSSFFVGACVATLLVCGTARAQMTGSSAPPPGKDAPKPPRGEAPPPRYDGTPLPNDDCAMPALVGLGSSSFNSSGATSQATDPTTCSFGAIATVWFQFTAATSNSYRVDTCGTSYDTILTVLTGATSCGPYSLFACNDDNSAICGSGNFQSAVTLCATAGTTYFVMVDSYDGSTGPGTLTITDLGSACTVPANDSCAGASALSGSGPYPVTGTEATSDAWNDVSDPVEVNCGFHNSHSVWFSWTPTENCEASFDTCGTDYDTVVTVYTGACGSLTEFACNDDSQGGPCAGTLQSSVSFSATAGTTYRIKASQYNANGTGGTLQYSLDCVTASVTCRRGNINGGAGPVADVLFLNGSPGTDPARTITIGSTAPFTLTLSQTPAGGQRYAMYVWVGSPTPATVRSLPLGVGMSCMPTPISGGTPQPRKIANNIGHTAQLGTENWPGPPTQPAPYTLLNLPGGVRVAGTFFFQGLMLDPGAPNRRAGVTNGIVVVSQ